MGLKGPLEGAMGQEAGFYVQRRVEKEKKCKALGITKRNQAPGTSAQQGRILPLSGHWTLRDVFLDVTQRPGHGSQGHGYEFCNAQDSTPVPP